MPDGTSEMRLSREPAGTLTGLEAIRGCDPHPSPTTSVSTASPDRVMRAARAEKPSATAALRNHDQHHRSDDPWPPRYREVAAVRRSGARHSPAGAVGIGFSAIR